MTPARAAAVLLLVATILAATLLPTSMTVVHAAPACSTAIPTAIPTDSTSIDDAAVWAVAGTRLSALARRPSFPFGATGRSAYRRTNAYAWTAGFFPTSLWLLYGRTHDPAALRLARAFTDRVLPVARWTGTHDLGFMVGLPAVAGMARDPDAGRRATYEVALGTAARSLSTRWNASVGALRSASYGGHWGLIIDSAMNAPLLIRASQSLGGADGARLAAQGLQHMLTLQRDLVRSDGSTIHRMAYDSRTGRALGPLPGQGLRASSTWSRGQAWAMAGFTQAFELTGDSRMLDAARRTSDFWMSAVPEGCVPPWDLALAPGSSPRDSSAAAIAADALLRLAAREPDATRAAADRQYARSALATLTSPDWVSRAPSARGVLQHQAYSIPLDAREGTYVWGDAFLLDALSLLDASPSSG
jgi:unsaturated chondroitin disaccharide hydrolase